MLASPPAFDDDMRYVAEVTIRRCTCFMLHPLVTNSDANQSSNSGLVGGVPLRPKSNTVGTSAVPMCRVQRWLTATRAVSGFRGSVIHSASALRRPVLCGLNVGAGSSAFEL